MADLKFPKFASNARIRRAAANAPAMKRGEIDRTAVAILQQALIDAGFAISDGATGFYGEQTAAAVRKLESTHGLDLDTGNAGHQVISTLDALLTGRSPIVFIRGVDLMLLLQHTTTFGGFTHRTYFAKAESLLAEFGIDLQVVDRRVPELEFPGSVDPANESDIAGVRALAEKHVPGSPNMLRVIFCRFSPSREFALTAGGAFPLADGVRVADFILIDVGKRRRDDCTLIHEMIHATGLKAHDEDPASVFSEGAERSVLKAEHAERLSKSSFAQPRH